MNITDVFTGTAFIGIAYIFLQVTIAFRKSLMEGTAIDYLESEISATIVLEEVKGSTLTDIEVNGICDRIYSELPDKVIKVLSIKHPNVRRHIKREFVVLYKARGNKIIC